MKGHRNLWLQCVNGIWPSDNTSWLQKNSHSNITKKSYKIRSMKPAMLLPLARSNQSCHLTNIAVVLQVQTEASGPRNCSRVVVTWVEQVPAFRHWRILNQLKLPSSAAFPSFFFFLFCSGCWHLRRQWFNPGTFNTKFCLTDHHSIKLLSCHPFAYKL